MKTYYAMVEIEIPAPTSAEARAHAHAVFSRVPGLSTARMRVRNHSFTDRASRVCMNAIERALPGPQHAGLRPAEIIVAAFGTKRPYAKQTIYGALRALVDNGRVERYGVSTQYYYRRRSL
jgi:hypothetical protein